MPGFISTTEITPYAPNVASIVVPEDNPPSLNLPNTDTKSA